MISSPGEEALMVLHHALEGVTIVDLPNAVPDKIPIRMSNEEPILIQNLDVDFMLFTPISITPDQFIRRLVGAEGGVVSGGGLPRFKRKRKISFPLNP